MAARKETREELASRLIGEIVVEELMAEGKCGCSKCPHVQYMNNKCSHPETYDRDLTYPARQTSHFPSSPPKWCPLWPGARRSMKENAR